MEDWQWIKLQCIKSLDLSTLKHMYSQTLYENTKMEDKERGTKSQNA